MLNMAKQTKVFISVLVIFFISASNTYAIEPEEKEKHSNLTKGVFLVASNKLQYSPLAKTVIYVTQHDTAGTSGFIINQATDLLINQAFPETQASKSTNKILYFGGPLHSKYLFMLTQTQFSRGLHAINKNIYFGAGEEVKMRLRSENKRDKIRIYAGFMSWGPHQVDDEISKGDWIITPAPSEQLFSKDTTKLWENLTRRWAGSWI